MLEILSSVASSMVCSKGGEVDTHTCLSSFYTHLALMFIG